jgi:carbon-monoxide dehydrogenase small subunit
VSEPLRFTVNGVEQELDAGASTTKLAAFLRDELGATDVKLGCEEGACGACSVLLDGEDVPSCLVLLGRMRGRCVRTPGHLARDELGRRIVAALMQPGALQCGFCTPGFLCAAYGLALARPAVAGAAVRARVEQALEGHLCRCTGYRRIVQAVEAAVGAE